MAEKAKYIDVKELSIILDIMKNPDSEFATDDYIDGFSDGISAAIKELEAFPTADVAPVVHGHWKHVAGMNSKCLECGRYFPVNEFEHRPFDINFCPNCGAKMDEEVSNDKARS